MKPRTTLLLALLAGGFFAYIWFVERHTETTRQGAESSAKILSVDQSKVQALSLQTSGTKIDLQKKDGVWRIEQPIADRADSLAINGLLTTLDSLRHDSKIEIPASQQKEKLQEYGLAESDSRVQFKTEDGKLTELLLGKGSAVEGKLYARVQGSQTVFVIPDYIRTQASKKPDEFRDKKLSDTTPQQVQKLAIKTPDVDLEAERKGAHWELTKPLKARGADSKINDLLAGILNANVTEFLEDKPTAEQGLVEPKTIVTFTVEGQKDPMTLKIGGSPAGETGKNSHFAKFSHRPAVTVLPNSAIDLVAKLRPNDLRDRKLARFETDVIDRLTIEPKDKPALTLVRKADGWIQKVGDKELKINESIPTKLIAALQSTDATNFVADTAAEPAKYGLDKPLVKVRLASFSSENTPESKAGERPVATLLFGTVEGDSGYAKLEDEPFVIASPKSLLESVPVTRAQLQPLRVWDFKADAVTALELTRDGSTVKLEKKDNQWKPASGEGTVNPDSVNAVLSVLGSVQTTKWMSKEEVSKDALEKPSTTVKVTLKDGDKSLTLSLTVGQALGSEGFFSKVEDKEGVFLLSNPDNTSLGIKLLH
jgi:hypothetical protein